MMESLAESSASLAWLAIRSGYSKCCTCPLPTNTELNLGACVLYAPTKSATLERQWRGAGQQDISSC